MIFSNKTMIIIIVSLALFMDTLDTTIINTAIPAMARSLQVNPVDLKIALISYLLVLAIIIPISGWIADKYGIKRVFIAALFIFTISSLGCGFSQTLTQLVIARCVQGFGGALMLPLGRLLLLHTFARHEIVDAMNHVVIIISLGLMLGPVAGGFITDHFSWPWIFWVNIPVGILTMGMASYYFKDTQPRRVRPFDILGFILFGGGLAALTFSLSDLSESTANQRQALFILTTSILMLFSYVLHSKRQKHPIVNANLFTIKTFKISMIGNLVARIGFGGVPFLLPLLMQIGLGFSAQLSGLLLVPIAIGILIIKQFSLPILRTFGYKKLLVTNTFFVGLSLFSFTMINQNSSVFGIALLTFIFGFLISLQYSGINTLGYADIPADELSAATSIASTVQQISQSFGVALGALLLRFYSDYSYTLTTTVFHDTFITMGLLTFFSSLIFIGLTPKDGHQMLSAPAQKKITLQSSS